MNNFTGPLLAFLMVILGTPVLAGTDGLSEDTGRQLLNELKEIRLLVEKQAKQPVRQAQPERGRPDSRIPIKDGGEYILGRNDAPLTLIEYTDYQYSYCARFQAQTFPDIKKKLIDTGKVRYIARDLPLAFHPFAMTAAHVTRCAGGQEKFWEMKEILFKKSDQT